jgi:hypothetical protein
VAVAYTNIYTKRVSALILIAPAGLMEELPLIGQIFSLPFVGETLIATGIANRLMKATSAKNGKIPFSNTQPTRLSSMSDEEYLAHLDSWRLVKMVHFQIDYHPGMNFMA